MISQKTSLLINSTTKQLAWELSGILMKILHFILHFLAELFLSSIIFDSTVLHQLIKRHLTYWYLIFCFDCDKIMKYCFLRKKLYDSGGFPLGSRSCSLEGSWLDPIWISSCNTSLHVSLSPLSMIVLFLDVICEDLHWFLWKSVF